MSHIPKVRSDVELEHADRGELPRRGVGREHTAKLERAREEHAAKPERAGEEHAAKPERARVAQVDEGLEPARADDSRTKRTREETTSEPHLDTRQSARGPEGAVGGSPGEALGGPVPPRVHEATRPADASILHDSAQGHTELRSQRQQLVTTAVNHMTLRRGASSTIELEHLGRIRVEATLVRGEVDVNLVAQDADTVTILRSTAAQLEQRLVQAAVEIGKIAIEHERPQDEEKRPEQRQRDDAERDGRTQPRRDRQERQRARERSRDVDPGRVRIVL